ncbi:nuclear transport factor 2 family protein [Dyadobacter pollutisoli]|uniref:Nuclear transport factor 2 family protein n=1 Tax=Dyadobacter pollutisoli TaxID=2910158 RepID=A0A9E8N9Z4_9BACT|nr:nuclear transport factor 2 family protein [Dyadobacter pollutisoli]WAC12635.1 nuclear transport factor 2 family protein [Dyadobacter pollutisoli]
MKLKFQKTFVAFMVSATTILSGTTCSTDRSEVGNYTAASSSYGILAEKSLDLLASFDLETWGTMLSDSVVYYFPDGDSKNSKKLTGKKALLTWWKNYIDNSGIRSMSIENASYLPIHVANEVRRGDISGTQVIAYFSNNMVYESGAVSVKMNFVIHFDENRMIDGYYTYYDRTPIIKILKEKSVPEQFAIIHKKRYQLKFTS